MKWIEESSRCQYAGIADTLSLRFILWIPGWELLGRDDPLSPAWTHTISIGLILNMIIK
jgi:hypothetical protein